MNGHRLIFEVSKPEGDQHDDGTVFSGVSDSSAICANKAAPTAHRYDWSAVR